MTGEARVAVISGGSSGIGLEIAHLLGERGYQLFLVARDQAKLEAARERLGQSRGRDVGILSVDVADEAACALAIDAIVGKAGRIDWLVTCAGIVEPGMFLDLSAETHRRQMDVNFFGTLNLVRPVAAIMKSRQGGRITMISSAAAFVGIAGYSGYAPGKFAVRALAETLRVELAPDGIEIGVAFPPDTDTPQLAVEEAAKPEATRRITAGGGVLSAETVARSIVAGALAGRFMLTPSRLMTAFGLLHSLYAPVFRWRQGRILRGVAEKSASNGSGRRD